MKRILIIVGVVLALAAVGYFVVLPQIKASSTSQTTYQTAPAELGDLTAYVGATGNVRSKQTAVLNWQTSGQVASIKVKPLGFINPPAVLRHSGKSARYRFYPGRSG
jgi:multidrug efflux pump subunit AcrA (membrane-fusion protein)